MKHLRTRYYLVMTVLALLAACSPGASPGETPIVPLTGGTPAGQTVLIQHQLIPNQLPGQRSTHAGDQDSSSMAAKKTVPGGDRFTFGMFERPFNANTMDVYFPSLDIQDALLYQDDTWVYGVIIVKGREANDGLPGKYALELDLDRDGRGEYLVMVAHPASADWTTDGVQVWADADGDVGGTTVVRSDDVPSNGDGYEMLIFDQGRGQDADAAWARISPDDPPAIQLAVKRSILGGATAYMAGMWAGNDVLNPALFDINDHFTHDQAGEASKDLEYYYPIKQVSELDNTCRMTVGFVAAGNEPLLCAAAVPPSESGCFAYGHACSIAAECCSGVPCTGGRCRYP
jgi:hypothetical protein